MLLARNDDLDLSDASLDCLMAVQNMLEQLDCQDDLTGGCKVQFSI